MKRIIILFLLILPVIIYAQKDSGRYVHKGLFRAQGTISPGIMLKNNSTTSIYLHGNVEYYVDNSISFRGDGFFSIGTVAAKGYGTFDYNHSVFAGASFHFNTQGHLDPYIGIEPGISIAQVLPIDEIFCIQAPCPQNYYSNPSQEFNPLISAHTGINYYFEKIFHLFAEIKYVQGNHLSNGPTVSLNELGVSFGLGFNFN